MSVGPDDNFTLQWNDYQGHLVSAFKSLRSDKEFVDLTLSCEGRKLSAHKMLMSACSPYFRTILRENPCPHPVIILRQTSYEDLVAIIQFIYNGEVSLHQSRVQSFIRTAKTLKIRGLCEDLGEDNGLESKKRKKGGNPAGRPLKKKVKVETGIVKEVSGGEFIVETTGNDEEGNETWEFDYQPGEDSGDDVENINLTQGTPQTTKIYPQRFREAWLKIPEFDGWLARVDEDRTKAKCTVCNKIMLAKLDLIKHHSKAKKHIKRIECPYDPVAKAVAEALATVVINKTDLDEATDGGTETQVVEKVEK